MKDMKNWYFCVFPNEPKYLLENNENEEEKDRDEDDDEQEDDEEADLEENFFGKKMHEIIDIY